MSYASDPFTVEFETKLRTRMSRFNIVKKVINLGGIVFGDFVRDTISGRKPDDIDIVFDSDEAAEMFHKELERKYGSEHYTHGEKFTGYNGISYGYIGAEGYKGIRHLDIFTLKAFRSLILGKVDFDVNSLVYSKSGISTFLSDDEQYNAGTNINISQIFDSIKKKEATAMRWGVSWTNDEDTIPKADSSGAITPRSLLLEEAGYTIKKDVGFGNETSRYRLVKLFYMNADPTVVAIIKEAAKNGAYTFGSCLWRSAKGMSVNQVNIVLLDQEASKKENFANIFHFCKSSFINREKALPSNSREKRHFVMPEVFRREDEITDFSKVTLPYEAGTEVSKTIWINVFVVKPDNLKIEAKYIASDLDHLIFNGKFFMTFEDQNRTDVSEIYNKIITSAPVRVHHERVELRQEHQRRSLITRLSFDLDDSYSLYDTFSE